MSNFYVLEAVNLFCGDDDPTKSKYLTLTSLQLPTMEEVMADHMPGGGVAGLSIGMGVLTALEAGFNLNGTDPHMLSLFGLGTDGRQTFTAYGVLRDKKTSEEIEVKSVMHALLGTVTPAEFTRGELQGYEYALREITHYESHFDGVEKHYMDYFTNQWRVDGVSKFKKRNAILRIPGG